MARTNTGYRKIRGDRLPSSSYEGTPIEIPSRAAGRRTDQLHWRSIYMPSRVYLVVPQEGLPGVKSIRHHLFRRQTRQQTVRGTLNGLFESFPDIQTVRVGDWRKKYRAGQDSNIEVRQPGADGHAPNATPRLTSLFLLWR